MQISFEPIYHEHHKMVFNLALQYVQNVEDAEEITQDTFVKIHEKLNKFNQQSNIKTWIYRIAINQSLDFIRFKNSKKRKFLSSLFSIHDDDFHFQPVHFHHPGVALEYKESAQQIFNAINQLPENQKTVIILIKIEGHSQKETAEIMNISVKATESLLQRAKNNLEKLIIKKD